MGARYYEAVRLVISSSRLSTSKAQGRSFRARTVVAFSAGVGIASGVALLSIESSVRLLVLGAVVTVVALVAACVCELLRRFFWR